MIGRTFTVLYHSRDKINDTDGIITICIRPFKSITTVLHSKANIGFIYGSLSAPVGPDFDSRIFLYGGDTLQIVSFPNPRTLPTSQYLRLHDHDVHLIFRYSFFMDLRMLATDFHTDVFLSAETWLHRCSLSENEITPRACDWTM